MPTLTSVQELHIKHLLCYAETTVITLKRSILSCLYHQLHCNTCVEELITYRCYRASTAKASAKHFRHCLSSCSTAFNTRLASFPHISFFQIRLTDTSWTKVFSSDPAIVFLSCGVFSILTLFTSSQHARKEKKIARYPTPTFIILILWSSLLALRLLQISDIHFFSLLIPHPFVHIPRHPFHLPGLVLTTLLFSSFRGVYDRNVRYRIS